MFPFLGTECPANPPVCQRISQFAKDCDNGFPADHLAGKCALLTCRTHTFQRDGEFSWGNSHHTPNILRLREPAALSCSVFFPCQSRCVGRAIFDSSGHTFRFQPSITSAFPSITCDGTWLSIAPSTLSRPVMHRPIPVSIIPMPTHPFRHRHPKADRGNDKNRFSDLSPMRF
jgi:hypothetical protein